MTEWTCWLPFPPSVNNAFTQGMVRGKIRRFPSNAYKFWRAEAVVRIRASWRAKPPVAAPVTVMLALTPKDRRPRDADNYCKPVLDALVVSGVLTDDSNRYVSAVTPSWENPAEEAGVVVSIRAAAALRPALTSAERALLKRVKAGAYTTIPPGFVQPPALWGLMEKGYVQAVPGLIDGVPQGYLACV